MPETQTCTSYLDSMGKDRNDRAIPQNQNLTRQRQTIGWIRFGFSSTATLGKYMIRPRQEIAARIEIERVGHRSLQEVLKGIPLGKGSVPGRSLPITEVGL